MESTSDPDKIQISRSTADQLIAGGKEHWLKPREDIVLAKGKGALRTFWLHIGTKKANSTTSSQEGHTQSDTTRSSEVKETDSSANNHRLIEWIVELLVSLIKTMVRNICHVKCC
jgi:hypothetical protein